MDIWGSVTECIEGAMAAAGDVEVCSREGRQSHATEVLFVDAQPQLDSMFGGHQSVC